MAQNSPIFFHNTVAALPAPLPPLGPGQFVSLFQRANFWTYTQPKATNPSYQVTLEQVLLNALENSKNTIEIVNLPTIPLANQINGTVLTDPNWCAPVAQIDVTQLDSMLQNVIIPELRKNNIVPTILPIFLFSNVVMYDSNLPTGQTCCILGYHNAYLSSITTGKTAGKVQTYIVANYDSTYCPTCNVSYSGAFPITPGSPGGPDIVALSTVIAGWMDNPTTLNTTPNWNGTINGVTGCQTALEVGFPPGLAGAVTAITMHDKVVYHVQDLAFKSWFYGDGVSTPNSGLGGNYSLFGTFTGASQPC
jgi:hypothetical protein